MDKIKITNDLHIGFHHLILRVDFSHEFTFKDLLLSLERSTIPMDIMTALLRCNYIPSYIEEIQKEFVDDNDIEYLEVYWYGDKYVRDNEQYTFWGFHGVGKEGNIPKDLVDAGIQVDNPEKYREQYAIEFSPLYKLSEYTIRIKPLIQTCIHNGKGEVENQIIDITPDISLLELLSAVIWELSWFGSTDDRDRKRKELDQSLSDF